MDHQRFMQRTLELARQAEQFGEVPVGAVVVHDNQIIGEGFNQVIHLNDPSAHAEAQAIRAAGNHLNNYRLVNTTLYVSLEPCAMCAGLITHARIQTLVFAASDPRTGATGSAINVLNHSSMNHKVQVIGGVLENESAALLQGFFRQRRKQAALAKKVKNDAK
ncbi:tRNA-specific adenosine deaminase [Pseudidiomarina piscicola]|uniref:tRNA-specific adenosine deaminase n=1 Tax=Pseudidiomarina piscicola TaxID=2614830 RepID=A0A7D9N2N0_9GAMM|nr:tRNA adenosine(34) deaminase TadA [Pseudidiomarina piscicola]CAB0151556.1 tRNA-specific adenosine deaminase [Pseudidiomarina piscicola]VZT41021.1 tRNA-specific adenosine deaminase [Pseudomonas aeruginosa]